MSKPQALTDAWGFDILKRQGGIRIMAIYGYPMSYSVQAQLELGFFSRAQYIIPHPEDTERLIRVTEIKRCDGQQHIRYLSHELGFPGRRGSFNGQCSVAQGFGTPEPCDGTCKTPNIGRQNLVHQDIVTSWYC